MKSIYHWTEYSWGLAQQYGIKPEKDEQRYQPFLLMATQLWKDIVDCRLLGRSALGITMTESPIDSGFRDKSHSYFTAEELNGWKNGRGYLFDNWKPPASAAEPSLTRAGNSKRDYHDAVKRLWKSTLTADPELSDNLVSEAIAEQFRASGFRGPSGKLLSAESIRKNYHPRKLMPL
jgi:hypothetical protein